MLFLCRIHHQIVIRPDKKLQIKGRKKSAHAPSCMKFREFTPPPPRYAYTINYHCVVLLQLLYRWQHQSQKLWIPPCTLFAGCPSCISQAVRKRSWIVIIFAVTSVHDISSDFFELITFISSFLTSFTYGLPNKLLLETKARTDSSQRVLGLQNFMHFLAYWFMWVWNESPVINY
jgi:hypothetical protein